MRLNYNYNYNKMLNGLLETEVKVGIEMKITIMTIEEVGV